MPQINLNNKKIKKIYVGNTQIKKAYVGNQLVYGAIPDYLYSNGQIDGEIFKTLTGSNFSNNNGYGFSASDFTLNYNGKLRIAAGASGGYGNTYSCANQINSNYADYSNINSLYIEGSLSAGGEGTISASVLYRLVDNQNKTFDLFSVTPSSFSKTVDISKSGINLKSCKMVIIIFYSHYAPWQNWYGGSRTSLTDYIIPILN